MNFTASKQIIESRDYNIITCQNFNRQQSQQALPPIRKLGRAQDNPFPKKAIFEIQHDNYQLTRMKPTQSGEVIKPTSLMNASSVNFNFLSLTTTGRQPIDELKNEGLKIVNKKKGGMSEVADLGGLCYPNFNKNYQDKIKENQTVFRKTKGMWPAVMEINYTYGPFMKPFKKLKF